MKKIVGYLRDYFVTLNKTVFLFATLFTAIAVYINYTFHLNREIYRLNEVGEFLGWYGVFFLALGFGYVLQVVFLQSAIFKNRKFVLLLCIAPAVFAWKMVADIEFHFSTDVFQNEYWNDVVYWPAKVLVITCLLFILHYFFNPDEPFYGLTLKGFKPKPYLIMLLIMVPLIAAASTQKDFL